jgi:hypothetical protein
MSALSVLWLNHSRNVAHRPTTVHSTPQFVKAQKDSYLCTCAQEFSRLYFEKKVRRSICSHNPWRMYTGATQTSDFDSLNLMVVAALRGPQIRSPPNVIATYSRRPFNGLRGRSTKRDTRGNMSDWHWQLTKLDTEMSRSIGEPFSRTVRHDWLSPVEISERMSKPRRRLHMSSVSIVLCATRDCLCERHII